MEKIKKMNLFTKIILGLMVVLPVVFAIVYIIETSKMGYEYMNSLLIKSEQDGNTVYSGKLGNKNASFTVSGGNTLVYKYGDTTYGPYVLREDTTMVSSLSDFQKSLLSNDCKLMGVELTNNNEVIFRGSVFHETINDGEEYFYVFDEKGSVIELGGYYETNHIVKDANGDLIGPTEPSITEVLHLIIAPQLRNKGNRDMWFVGTFIVILNIISIYFAENLFRFDMSLKTRSAQNVEPSELVIMGRYISWSILTLMAIVVYVVGLFL